MIVRVHGFDWIVYCERVMPAFARWLIDENESAIYRLYEQTRSAQGEQFVPEAVKHLCVWPRAQAFVKQLPRGPQARREYQKLCAAELFTALSDNYMRQYPPRLYQNSEALRTVWGAIVEQFCLPWLQLPEHESKPEPAPTASKGPPDTLEQAYELETNSEELISLLHAAGLDELAQQVNEQIVKKGPAKIEQEVPNVQDLNMLDDDDITDEEAFTLYEEDAEDRLPGLTLGRHPAVLNLRGWLATISVRAMALFEHLTCGRRCMPFGYQPGEPFESYIGYLTPDEVWQLALCLAEAQPPDPNRARADYRNFRDHLSDEWDEFRMIDEVLPAYAGNFLQAIHNAAHQGQGLICSVG